MIAEKAATTIRGLVLPRPARERHTPALALITFAIEIRVDRLSTASMSSMVGVGARLIETGS
jgi:hypothetical protein